MDHKIISFALKAHQDTNQKYDDHPYAVHLAMVIHYCYKYLDVVPGQIAEDIVHACWLHDVIEDCRITYNDVRKISNENVANLVYAVTNNKGKNRSDRANEDYYTGIRQVSFAKFIKMCDRLANVKYSLETRSRMINMYRKENEHFLSSLHLNQHYDDMVSELNNLLNQI